MCVLLFAVRYVSCLSINSAILLPVKRRSTNAAAAKRSSIAHGDARSMTGSTMAIEANAYRSVSIGTAVRCSLFVLFIRMTTHLLSLVQPGLSPLSAHLQRAICAPHFGTQLSYDLLAEYDENKASVLHYSFFSAHPPSVEVVTLEDSERLDNQHPLVRQWVNGGHDSD